MIYELIDRDRDTNNIHSSNRFIKSEVTKKDFKKLIKKLRKEYKVEIASRNFNTYNIQTVIDCLQPNVEVLEVEEVFNKKVIKLKW